MKIWLIPSQADRAQGWTTKTLFDDKRVKRFFDEVKNPYDVDSALASFLLENWPDNFKRSGPIGSPGTPTEAEFDAEVERRVKIRLAAIATEKPQGEPTTIAAQLEGQKQKGLKGLLPAVQEDKSAEVEKADKPLAPILPTLTMEQIANSSKMPDLRKECKKRKIKIPPGSTKLALVKLIDEKAASNVKG